MTSLTETDLAPAASTSLVDVRGVSKSFGATRALIKGNFDVRPGEVHVLAGENGAGKSTLIKILGGVHRPDAGTVCRDGAPISFRSPREAMAAGVSVIHQELSLIPTMSVMDNIMLGREHSVLGFMTRESQRAFVDGALARIGLAIDPDRLLGSLPVGAQQMIEICKALSTGSGSRLIIMDEPTSALTEPEVERLFTAIAGLKADGCGIIYITHKLEEVYRIADRITVLRDGQHVITAPVDAMPANELIRHMVGRPLAEQIKRRAPLPGVTVLTALGLTVIDRTVHSDAAASPDGTRRVRVSPMNLTVRAGEIVGLAGLQGSGAGDVLAAVFGALDSRYAVHGSMTLAGRSYIPQSPGRAIANGVALLTSDRHRTGFVPAMSIRANTSLAALQTVSPLGWLLMARERALADAVIQTLRVRAQAMTVPITTLSGGNQQKIVLAKWMCTSPRLLLLDEPTRGVDVGAKHEIYELMNQWTEQGMGILLITSEMPELLAMADRIVVMHRGRVMDVMTRNQADAERIIHAAMGGEINGIAE
ncbi:MAG: sugar ABC transporter ATP-binding protein [Planctomycetes bacterium]|nr:sugar ABC transporter ATP-binding protein [Planctomycetota bacterium]